MQFIRKSKLFLINLYRYIFTREHIYINFIEDLYFFENQLKRYKNPNKYVYKRLKIKEKEMNNYKIYIVYFYYKRYR